MYRHLASRSTWLKPVKETATNLHLGCLSMKIAEEDV